MCSLNLKSKQNSRVCDHRAILSLPPLPCHCLFPACVYTHVLAYTHTCVCSQAHTVLTRTHSAFTDTHIHTHSLPHWPFPVSTCFSLASFSSTFSLWFCLLITPALKTLGSSAKMLKYLIYLLRETRANAPRVCWRLASCKSAINFALPPPCQKKQREGSGFFKAFSLPGTGHSLLTLSATLRDPDYFFHVSDEEIKAQRTW